MKATIAGITVEIIPLNLNQLLQYYKEEKSRLDCDAVTWDIRSLLYFLDQLIFEIQRKKL